MKLFWALLVTFISPLALSKSSTSLASDIGAGAGGGGSSPKNEDQNILMYSNEGNPVIDDFDEWIPLPWIKLITDAGFRRKTPPPPEYLTIDEAPEKPMSPPYELNHQNQLKRTLESPVMKAKKLNNNNNNNNNNNYQSNKNQPLPPPSPSPPSSTSSYSTSSRSRTQQTASLPPSMPHITTTTTTHRASKDAGQQQQHCTCTPIQKYSSPLSSSSSFPNSPSKSPVSQSKFSYKKNTATNLLPRRKEGPYRKEFQQQQQQKVHHQKQQYSLPRIQQKKLRLPDDDEDVLGDVDDVDDEYDYTSLILEGITNSELEIKCSQLFESKRRQRAPVATRLPSPSVIKSSNPPPLSLPPASPASLTSPVSTLRPVSVVKSPFKLNPGPRTYRPTYSPPISNIANFANIANIASSSSSHQHPHRHRHSSSSSPPHPHNRNVIRTNTAAKPQAPRGRGMASKSISFTSKPLNRKSSWNPFTQLPSKCR